MGLEGGAAKMELGDSQFSHDHIEQEILPLAGRRAEKGVI